MVTAGDDLGEHGSLDIAFALLGAGAAHRVDAAFGRVDGAGRVGREVGHDREARARVGAGEYCVSAYGFEPRGLRWEVFVRLSEESL